MDLGWDQYKTCNHTDACKRTLKQTRVNGGMQQAHANRHMHSHTRTHTLTCMYTNKNAHIPKVSRGYNGASMNSPPGQQENANPNVVHVEHYHHITSGTKHPSARVHAIGTKRPPPALPSRNAKDNVSPQIDEPSHPVAAISSITRLSSDESPRGAKVLKVSENDTGHPAHEANNSKIQITDGTQPEPVSIRYSELQEPTAQPHRLHRLPVVDLPTGNTIHRTLLEQELDLPTTTPASTSISATVALPPSKSRRRAPPIPLQTLPRGAPTQIYEQPPSIPPSLNPPTLLSSDLRFLPSNPASPTTASFARNQNAHVNFDYPATTEVMSTCGRAYAAFPSDSLAVRSSKSRGRHINLRPLVSSQRRAQYILNPGILSPRLHPAFFFLLLKI